VDLLGAAGHKSARSGQNGCVEVEFLNGQVVIRDSKDRNEPAPVLIPANGGVQVGFAKDGGRIAFWSAIVGLATAILGLAAQALELLNRMLN
jgi:hypothetical protein